MLLFTHTFGSSVFRVATLCLMKRLMIRSPPMYCHLQVVAVARITPVLYVQYIYFCSLYIDIYKRINRSYHLKNITAAHALCTSATAKEATSTVVGQYAYL